MNQAENSNKYGLSKKTNLGIAAMAALSASQQSGEAILAISIIACLGIIVQGLIDYKKIGKEFYET